MGVGAIPSFSCGKDVHESAPSGKKEDVQSTWLGSCAGHEPSVRLLGSTMVRVEWTACTGEGVVYEVYANAHRLRSTTSSHIVHELAGSDSGPITVVATAGGESVELGSLALPTRRSPPMKTSPIRTSPE